MRTVHIYCAAVALLFVGAVCAVTPQEYVEALGDIDFDAVRADLKKLMVTSQDFWPADYGNYGPFFIRLAWHCAGSYRTSDGRGGCDGARQRFDPERSWDDNTNLDKARHLLVPIKEKYGDGLSWGDLIILAGNTAIESMGGPVFGFCPGRVDAQDGGESIVLGPTPEQEALSPCEPNGDCKVPFGSTTVGLIYVNPEGPMGKPIPEGSAPQIRDTFGRMSMNDFETVALIGGGHAFGKTHGACPAGPGPSPKEDPTNPWPGKCGTGKGKDAFTSGFEGPWSTTPTKWGNGYFKNLLKYKWEVQKGPGGHFQWKVSGAESPKAPAAHDSGNQDIMMLTSDVSLLRDPKYRKIVQTFAENITAFEEAFSAAWYKLTTRDVGPVTRCFGKNVPPAQPWQNPLPPVDMSNLPNFDLVKADLNKVFSGLKDTGAFAYLAWRCAATFRKTDYQGGCNGARIRFSPEIDWSVNKGVKSTLGRLTAIKKKYGDALSWADLIVLSGTTALNSDSKFGNALPFCGGRADATDGKGSQNLTPASPTSALKLKDTFAISALTTEENVAALGAQYVWQNGQSNPSSNEFFQILLANKWVKDPSRSGQYKASGKNLWISTSQELLLEDSELLSIAKKFASDEAAYIKTITSAWNKLMIADRFDGPAGNVCASAVA